MKLGRGGGDMGSRERGESKLPLIIMILLLAAIVYVLVKMIPPRVNAYEFRDYMETYARLDSWSHTEEQTKKDLLEKAKSLDLPIQAKDITVERRGSRMRISAKFDVPVDLKVKTWVLHYEFSQDAEHY